MVNSQALRSKNELELLENPVRCRVKWFNLQKGYGFLEPFDKIIDIFMHFSVLEQAGFQTVSPGDEVICEVGPGNRGVQALKILNVTASNNDNSIAPLKHPFAMTPGFLLEEYTGVVKWFNVLKGYGFVQPDDQGRDIFIHTSLLRHLHIDRLLPGTRVRVRVLSSERGREAKNIFLENEEENSLPMMAGLRP